MASLVLPQVLVFQEFRAVPTELVEPLRAFIFGPEYDLHRYSVDSEKVKAGTYSLTAGNAFNWLSDLDRAAGAIVDQDYTKVYMDDAYLAYYSNDNDDGTTVQNPSGKINQVKISGVNLVAKTGFALDASFYTRDVQVGDGVYLEDSGTEHYAAVTGFVAETVAASIGTASAGSANKATQSASAPSPTTVVGTSDVDTIAGTYDGLAVGVLTETYTVEVIKASIGGDPTTAILNITSASGEDDSLGFVSTASDWTDVSSITLGANGLSFNLDASTDVEVGWKWTIAVAQAYTAAVPTSGGTFTGDFDTNYVVTVTRGGDKTAGSDDDKPIVVVTTSTGDDGASPLIVGSSAINVGNYGVTMSWAQDELVKGDRFYAAATGEGDGAIQTLILDKSLPSALQDTDLNVKLCIKKDLEVHETLFNEAFTNWTQTDTVITVNPAAKEYDSGWRSGDYALPIINGDIYVHWRELLVDHADKVYTIATSADMADEFSTPVDPDNPLVYGLSKALANTGEENSLQGTNVKVMAVPTNDLTGYSDVLSKASNRDDLYTFVPLTFDRNIQNAVASHVTELSTPENALWRTAFVSTEEVNPGPITQKNTDSTNATATVDGSGYVDIDSGSDVDFVAAGVKAGDKIRINYGSDKYGVETYEEYTVDTVESATRVLLTSDSIPDPVIDTAVRFETWRNLDEGDVVTTVGTAAGSFASRRVYNVYPSTIPSGGVNVAGYYLAAAIAGLIGSVSPQQGLTNVEIKGFDNADSVVNRFSRSQLDSLMNYGVWIVTSDLQDGSIHTRRQLSTDTTDINTQELNVVKNVDSISYFFKNRLARYIGRANVTPSTIEVLRTQIDSGIAFLQASRFSEITGGQVIEGTSIREVRPHTLLKDRVVITIDLVIPYPLNNIELNLVI